MRKLVIPIANYPDRLGLSGEFVENCKETNFFCNYLLSDKVRYSVMASKTSNLTWSKDLGAGTYCKCGPGSVVGITIGYGLDGSGIESRWGRDFSHLSRPTLGPTQPPV